MTLNNVGISDIKHSIIIKWLRKKPNYSKSTVKAVDLLSAAYFYFKSQITEAPLTCKQQGPKARTISLKVLN